MSKNINKLFIFILFPISNVFLLKITKFYVPSTIILDKRMPDKNNVNLTCNYRYIRYERGFVLKWYYKHELFYIWNPTSKELSIPQIFGRFIDHVNVPRSINGTLELRNISEDFSGEYQCITMTYESLVTKRGHLQVIIPEDDFLLERIISSRFIEYRCAVNNIFPSPHLKIHWISPVLFSVTKYGLQGENGLYDVSESVYTSNRKALDANVSCELKISNTDYRKQLLFDDKESNTIEVS